MDTSGADLFSTERWYLQSHLETGQMYLSGITVYIQAFKSGFTVLVTWYLQIHLDVGLMYLSGITAYIQEWFHCIAQECLQIHRDIGLTYLSHDSDRFDYLTGNAVRLLRLWSNVIIRNHHVHSNDSERFECISEGVPSDHLDIGPRYLSEIHPIIHMIQMDFPVFVEALSA